jgi:uncharacterized protein with PQ loop repeat
MESRIVGFVATSTSIVAFGSQFIHTLQSKNTEGVSLYRTVFDSVSLCLWVYYAARGEDNPLLIATSFELICSICLLSLIVKNRNAGFFAVKEYTPPPSPPSEPKFLSIEIKERRNSL